MPIEGKTKIILPFQYPQTSIVISNNDRDLALMFEISFKKIIKDEQKQKNRFESSYGQQSTTFSPSKGILLPSNSQLINIKIQTLEDKNKIRSIPQKRQAPTGLRWEQKDKKKRMGTKPEQSVTTLIGTINISYSYLLHYNQQKLHQQIIKVSSLNLNRLTQIQTQTISLYLQHSTTPNTNIIHPYQISVNRSSLINNIHKNEARNQNKYKTMVSNLSKQPQSAVNIDISYQKSLLKKNSSLIQESPKSQNSNQNQIDNFINKLNENDDAIRDKLNQDFDLIKSKTSLYQIQAKRSDMFLKMLSCQKMQDNFYKNNDFIDQKSKVKGFQKGIMNDNLKTPVFLTQNSPIDQSIVIKSFHNIDGQREKEQVRRLSKNNSLSMELIVIAVIAAVFVSLGAHLRALLS